MNSTEMQEFIKDQVRKGLGFDSEPQTVEDVWKYNKRFLESMIDAIQFNADQLNKGCVVELKYRYLEDLGVAKLVGVGIKGQHQFDQPAKGLITTCQINPEFWEGDKKDE